MAIQCTFISTKLEIKKVLKNKKIIKDILTPYLVLIKKISWEFLLFFSLLTLFFDTTLKYLINICPDKAPLNNSWLINLIIILLIFSFLASSFYWAIKKNKNKIKISIIICILIIQVLILASQIYKKQAGAWRYPHDGATQTEVAIDFLLQGENPYQKNYYNTALDNPKDRIFYFDSVGKKWAVPNPALESYVYMPLSFILPLPFKYISEQIFHFYDNRIFIFLIYLLSCLLIYKLPNSPKKKIGLLIFFCLNYFALQEIIFGYSDAVPGYFLLLACYFLKKEYYSRSIAMISLAGLAKQNMIFFWPFFLAYIFFKKNSQFNRQSLFKFIKYPLIILSITCLVLLPFILWCPSCFYHDTIYYLGHIYPARGLGLAGLLLQLKIISNPFQFYNFMLWQILFILIFLPLLLYRQYKDNTLRTTYLNGTLLMGGVWFLSRYFTDSHLNFVITNLLISLFL